MTIQNWVTLVVAVIGVLHGPATQAIIDALTGDKAKK